MLHLTLPRLEITRLNTATCRSVSASSLAVIVKSVRSKTTDSVDCVAIIIWFRGTFAIFANLLFNTITRTTAKFLREINISNTLRGIKHDYFQTPITHHFSLFSELFPLLSYYH